MGRVGLDANVFLCVLLPESTIAGKQNIRGSEEILSSLGRDITAVTSTIVFAEIAWAFAREGKTGVEMEAAKKVIETMEGLNLVPVDADIAFQAGRLRRRHYSKKSQISYQDAIYLATCLKEQVKVFYTTDSHLLGLKEGTKIKKPRLFSLK